MTRWLPYVIVVAVLGAGAAGWAATRLTAPAEDGAVALVPAGAHAYATVHLNPSLAQKRALLGLRERLPERLGDDLADLLATGQEEGSGQDAIVFERDVQPWLGDQAAGFVTLERRAETVHGALIVAVTDRDAARATVDRALVEAGGAATETATHRGSSYQRIGPDDAALAAGFVRDWLVAGTEAAFKSVVDTDAGGPGLATEERYSTLVDALPADRLAHGYFDGVGITEQVAGAGFATGAAGTAALGGLDATAAFAVSARSDGLVFDQVGTRSDGAPADAAVTTDLLRTLPAPSLGALAVPDLGRSLTASLDIAAGRGSEQDWALERELERATGFDVREDLLSWMGDAGLVVGGTSLESIVGGLVVDSSDPAATRRAVEEIGSRLAGEGVPVEPVTRGDAAGFVITEPGVPGGGVEVLAGEKLVVAAGGGAADALLAPPAMLGEDALYRSAAGALGEAMTPMFLLDVPASSQWSRRRCLDRTTRIHSTSWPTSTRSPTSLPAARPRRAAWCGSAP